MEDDHEKNNSIFIILHNGVNDNAYILLCGRERHTCTSHSFEKIAKQAKDYVLHWYEFLKIISQFSWNLKMSENILPITRASWINLRL